MSQHTQVNSATGLLGSTGAGKTSLLATAAEYLADTFPGQVMALYSADGGGYPTKMQALIKAGVVRVFRMRTRGEAFETCVLASRGWWPSRIDSRSGETEPHVRMVPPITEKYAMGCPNGHVVKVVPTPQQLTPGACPTCKVLVTKETMSVTKSSARTRGFEKVGAVAYDGMTSFLSWMMDDMAGRHARQELKGEDSALGGRIVSGSLSLGGNNRSHFGFVQGRAENMVLSSNGIPGLSLTPFWTGLLLETSDEGGLPVKGMKLVGKAKTDEAGAWFGNMLEVTVVKEEGGADVRRLYLGEYMDDSNVKHLLKHRGSPKMPPYLQDDPGQPWGNVHLGVFFTLLAKDIEQNAAQAEAKYGQVEGGIMEFGEAEPAALPIQPVAAVASPTAAVAGAQPTLRAPAPKPRAPKPVAVAAVVAPQAPAPSEEPTGSTGSLDTPVGGSPAASTPVGSSSAPLAEAAVQPASPAQPASPELATAPAAPAPPAPPAPSIARGPQLAPPPGPRPPAVAPRRPPVAVAPRPVALPSSSSTTNTQS